MFRFLAGIALVGLLAACGSFSPSIPPVPERTVIGMSVPRPVANAAADPASDQALDWKVSQICTHGADLLKEDVEPAEAQRQLIDRQVRCRPYRLSLF